MSITSIDKMTNQLTLKELIRSFGIKNLVFILDVDCFDKNLTEFTSQFGFGLTTVGENTKRCTMKIDHSRFDIDSSNKVVLISNDYDVLVPVQRYYVSDFNTMIDLGQISVYFKSEDGLNAISVCLVDLLSEEDKRCIEYVEGNFLLLQPFIGTVQTAWN